MICWKLYLIYILVYIYILYANSMLYLIKSVTYYIIWRITYNIHGIYIYHTSIYQSRARLEIGRPLHLTSKPGLCGKTQTSITQKGTGIDSEWSSHHSHLWKASASAEHFCRAATALTCTTSWRKVQFGNLDWKSRCFHGFKLPLLLLVPVSQVWFDVLSLSSIIASDYLHRAFFELWTF